MNQEMSHRTELAEPAQLRQYAAFAQELAQEAAAVAVAQMGQHPARRKGDGTLVTKTDQQLDRLISERIRHAYPNHAVLSEEQETRYSADSAFTWIVDPLDGTTNFVHGLPIWGVSIALVLGGVVIVGVIDFPLLHETFIAIKGAGAQRNQVAIQTSEITALNDEEFLMECTRTRKRYAISLPLKSRTLGSAAYHLCKVADGTALAGVETTPKVWDVAAALLLLDEAGGAVCTLNESALPFPLAAEDRDYRSLAYPLLTAANPALLSQVAAGIKQR